MNIKRVLVPAFFVIDLSENDLHKADTIADAMRSAANNCSFSNAPGAICLLLDEDQTNKVIEVTEEYPHAFPYDNDLSISDEPPCICGSRLFDSKGNCQKCGL